MEFDFVLTGQTSLLMSADNIEATDELTAWRKNPKNKKLQEKGDDRSPPWSWQTRLHTDGFYLAMPSAAIMAMLREAGKKMILKGNTTFKAETQSALLIETEYCDLHVGDERVSKQQILAIKDLPFAEQSAAVKKMGFALDVRRGAVSSSKHVRVRARFSPWQVRGHIEITDPTVLKEEQLNTLFEIGGLKCGLLDWRPNSPSPGQHGKFDYELVPVA